MSHVYEKLPYVSLRYMNHDSEGITVRLHYIIIALYITLPTYKRTWMYTYIPRDYELHCIT